MKRIIASFLATFFSLLLEAQTYDVNVLKEKYDIWTMYLAPEKLYLHMDRTSYLAGETIWFNGYLTNASRVQAKAPSRYIYTELLDSDGHDVIRVKTRAADHVEPRSGARIEASRETQPSLVYFMPKGYQSPKHFYSPRYEDSLSDGIFDERNTIFWKTGVTTSDGKAVVRFCDTDQQDYPYLLRVEGFTKDGRPFSLEQLVGERPSTSVSR